MDKMDEMVAVVPATVVDGYRDLPGLHSLTRDDCVTFEATLQEMEYRRRGDVEEDESVLQVIPYTYVVNETYDQVLSYVRSAKGGEGRLHGKASIGLGGHLSIEDAKPGVRGWDLLYAAARRELSEEVGLSLHTTPMVALKPDALLFDCTTPVGRVHLGVVLQGWILGPEPTLTRSDEEIAAINWEPIPVIKVLPEENLDRYERWSQIILRYWREGHDFLS